MSFKRTFTDKNINLMQKGIVETTKRELVLYTYGEHYLRLDSADNATLFALLKADVVLGNVFPAVRNDELHFYYKGGCLFKFRNGAFYRDKNYEGYSQGTEDMSTYERAKKQNENRYSKSDGEAKERQLLDELYCHTYGEHSSSQVVVLDVEVNLKDKDGHNNKCDLVLLNTQTDELMFVEGKVYDDERVRSAVGHPPKVIGQVANYTAVIAEQSEEILAQYCCYVEIVNTLFGTTYKPPQRLIKCAKLLVFKTGGGVERNVRYTIDTINEQLGADNVMWVKDERPTLQEVWDALKGETCK